LTNRKRVGTKEKIANRAKFLILRSKPVALATIEQSDLQEKSGTTKRLMWNIDCMAVRDSRCDVWALPSREIVLKSRVLFCQRPEEFELNIFPAKPMKILK
jgi:hypothetical protein